MSFSSLPLDESKLDKNWVVSKKIILELMASIEERDIFMYMHLFLNFWQLDYATASDVNMRDAFKRKGTIRYLPFEDLFFGTKLTDGTHAVGTFQVNHDIEIPASSPFARQYNVIFWDKDSIDTSLAWKSKNVVFCIKDASLYWFKAGIFVKDEGENAIPIYYSDKIIQRLLQRLSLVTRNSNSAHWAIDYDGYNFGTGLITPNLTYSQPASDVRTVWGTSATSLDIKCCDTPVYAHKAKAYSPNDWQTFEEYIDAQAIHFSTPPTFVDTVLSPFVVNDKSVNFLDEQKEDKLVLAMRQKDSFGNPAGGPDSNGVDGEDIQKLDEDYYYIGNGITPTSFQTYLYFKRGSLIEDFNIIPTTASLINWIYYVVKNLKWAVLFDSFAPSISGTFSFALTVRSPLITYFHSLAYGGSSVGQPCGTFVGYNYVKSTVKGVNSIVNSSTDGFQFANSTISITPQGGANCLSFIYLMNGAGGVATAPNGCGVANAGAGYNVEVYVDITNALIWK